MSFVAKCIKTNYRDFYSWRKEKSTAATVSGRNLKISSLAQTLKLTASCLYELTRGDKLRVPSSSKGQGWDHLACSRDTIYTLAPVTTCSEINAVVHKKKGKSWHTNKNLFQLLRRPQSTSYLIVDLKKKLLGKYSSSRWIPTLVRKGS